MIAGLSAGAAKLTTEGLGKYVPGYDEAASKFDHMLENITGLDRIKGPSELLFGSPDRSGFAPDTMSSPYKDVTPRTEEDNDALVKAIQAAKVNVSNNVNLNVTLDGQAIDAKITEVTERANYSTIDDVKSTTAR